MKQTIFQKLLGMAFIFGPLLTLTAAIIWLSGIGVNPGIMAWGSYIEGIIGYFGFILLVPVFLSLAYYLADYMPRFAAFIAILALIGFAGGGVMNMALRVIVHEFVNAGATEAMFEQIVKNWEEGNSIGMILILTGPLGPLSSVLLGIGFLIKKVIRIPALLLLVAGLLFMSGQLLQLSPSITYPLATALWAIALIPLGIKLISGQHQEIWIVKNNN